MKVDNRNVGKFLKRFSIFTFQFSLSQGQTLIETLAALAIIGIVISAIAVVVTTSLSNATFNANQTLATKYAQQGAELMQQIRDDSYTNFKNYQGTYCLAKNQTALGAPGNCTTPNLDNFIRSITVQQNGCGTNIAQITVDVKFTDGKCSAGVYCHQQRMLTCLSTENPIQAP